MTASTPAAPRRIDPAPEGSPASLPTAADPHLQRYRALATLMDEAFRVPGIGVRFGLDSIIGLVPGVGDMVGGLMAAYAILVAARLGASPSVLARMVGNIATDTFAGEIPVIGDLFDIGFKSNVRNHRLLEAHLANPAGARRASRWVIALLVAGMIVLFGAMAWLSVWVLLKAVRFLAAG